MRARAAELGKTLLIWVLLLSLLWLTGLAWVYDDSLLDAPALAWVSDAKRLLGFSGTAPDPIAPPDGRVAREAARPVRVAVMQAGARLGAQYAPETVNALYERLKNIMGEAIGSAAPPRRQTRAEWERALAYDSVYWEYAAAVPLSVLAEWLSVAPPAGFDAPVRRFFLSNRDGALALFFLNEESLVPYVSDTALTFEPVDTSGLSPCRFAFEAGGGALARAPDTLMFDAPPVLMAVRCEAPALVPAEAEIEAFLRGLRVNPDTPAHYTEPDGTAVYMDDPRICRFSPDGVVRYRAHGAADGAVSDTPAGRIEAARALLETLAPLLGDARFSLSGCVQEEDRFVVDFDYETQGAAVLPPAGDPAARVVLSGGVISEVTVRVRRFTQTDERVDLMPESLAYRLFADRIPVRTFALEVCFADGTGLQAPRWYGKN